MSVKVIRFPSDTGKDLPEIGKVYKYYDDGKFSPSREYRCLIVDIFKKGEAPWPIEEVWENMKSELDWIFAEDTDYFIVGYVKGESGYTTIFARDQEGYWYGCSTTSSNYDYTGVLVTDENYSLENTILEKH